MNDTNRTAERPRPAASRRGVQKIVLLLSPDFLNTSVVRRVLESEGARAITPEEIASFGLSLPEAVAQAVAEADAVVAIIDGTPRSNSVLFELGMAQGMKKPVVVILPPDRPATEFGLSGLPYLRAGADDEEALRFGLGQFLAAPLGKKAAPQEGVTETRPIGELADALLKRVRSGEVVTDEDLAVLVAEAIGRTGALVRKGKPFGVDGGADLAVWSDDLLPWLGNPLLIELKTRLLSKEEARQAVEQLRRYLDRANVLWGLLLFQYASPDALEELRGSSVLSMSAEELLEGLRETAFGPLMLGLRNRLVHGAK